MAALVAIRCSQFERVADKVGNILHFTDLIIMGNDNGIQLFLEVGNPFSELS
jgi:hypothetical protein